MKKILLIAILAFLPITSNANPCGFYLFGGGGASNALNIQNSNSIVIDDVLTNYDATLVASNITGSANVGIGYNVCPCVGIQGNFVYWGHQDYGVSYQFPEISFQQSGHSRTYSYGIEAIGYLPLCCETINPFLKIGYARYHSHWRFRSNTGIALEDNTNFTNRGHGVVFGAGVAFAFHKCWDLALQAQALYTDRQNVIDSHVTLYQYSVNLVYHFGA